MTRLPTSRQVIKRRTRKIQSRDKQEFLPIIFTRKKKTQLLFNEDSNFFLKKGKKGSKFKCKCTTFNLMTHQKILFLEKCFFNLFYLLVFSKHTQDVPRAGEVFHTHRSPKHSSKLPYLPMFFMRILASGGISSGSLCRDKGGQSCV